MYSNLIKVFGFSGIFFGILCALGNVWSALELFAHIQPWLLILLSVVLLFSLRKQFWVMNSLLIIVTGYHAAVTFPFIKIPNLNGTPPIHQDSSFRILQFNINANNGRWQDIADSVAAADPDIFVLCEANINALGRFIPLEQTYPYRMEVGRWVDSSLHDVSGTVLWSKHPFRGDDPLLIRQGKIQACYAIVQFPKHEVAVYAAHFVSPVTEKQIDLRNHGIMEISEHIARDPTTNVVLIGDMNQTVWTPVMRNLFKTTQMTSIYKGRMFLSTWPAQLHPFGIGIDHICYRGDLECERAVSADGIGSDHRMLITDFYFKNPSTNTPDARPQF